MNHKRHKPNPKQDAYLGYTQEGRVRNDQKRAPVMLRCHEHWGYDYDSNCKECLRATD